jgi:hypothetical protein
LPLAFLITLEIVGTRDSVSEFSELLRGVPTETNGAHVNIMTCYITERQVTKTSDNKTNPTVIHQNTVRNMCF